MIRPNDRTKIERLGADMSGWRNSIEHRVRSLEADIRTLDAALRENSRADQDRTWVMTFWMAASVLAALLAGASWIW